MSAIVLRGNATERRRPRAGVERGRLPGLRVRIVLAIVGLNLIIATLVISFLIDYGASVRRQAWTDAENLSRALDAALEGKFAQIDLVLQSVADEYRRQLTEGGVKVAELQTMLDRQAARLPDTAGLRVVDAFGDMRYASQLKVPDGINVSDREYFRELRDNPNVGMVISRPEFGQLINKWIVIFARRLSGPDGAFAGEILAVLPTKDLERMFSTINVGPSGVVNLLNQTPTLVARFPVAGPSGVAALAPPPSAPLRNLLVSGRASAAYRSVSGADGIARTYFFRRMDQFPLSLVVGLADSDYFADWRAVATHLATLYGLFLIASIIGGATIYSRVATQARADAQSRLAASVYENSSEGMAIFDAKWIIVDANRAFAMLTGFSAEEARGQKITRLFSTRRNIGALAGAARSLRATGHWTGELWLSRKGDEPFLARASISKVDGGAGEAKYVALFSDATREKRAQEQIWRHANFDTVTQLPNRRHFCELLRAEIEKAEAAKTEIAIIFIDLDRFKDVNDRFGHAVGDKLLQQAAERIRSCVRADDVVARLGGDEFTVMLPERRRSRGRRAFRSAHRLDARPSLHARRRTDIQFGELGSDPLSARRLGRRDAARQRGPGDVCRQTRGAQPLAGFCARASRRDHDPRRPRQRSARCARQQRDRAPLPADRRDRLRPHHQGRGAGALAPSQIRPGAAERIHPDRRGDGAHRRDRRLGVSQRRRAGVALAARVRTFVPDQRQCFGSAVDDRQRRGGQFRRIIARPGLGPGAMIIEITESVLIDASDTVQKLFERYRQAGFGIAIDDFGTGYSSLAYLKNFDIDYLKIDRGLVSSLTERTRDYAICEAVIAMAHKLGIRVIAEGVETEAQRALLAAAGCDCAQGYLYSRPLPASEFEATFFGKRLRAVS